MQNFVWQLTQIFEISFGFQLSRFAVKLLIFSTSVLHVLIHVAISVFTK